jgi:hypothetical protein
MAFERGAFAAPRDGWYLCPIVRSSRARLALALYSVMALGAVAWGALAGDLDLYHHQPPLLDWGFPGATALSAALGLVVAVAVIAFTRVAVRHTQWARRLHVEFKGLLGPLTAGEIALFALSSGLAEEMLFRGAMLPSLGIVASSVIFGLVHIGPVRTFWPWTLWAMGMGFVLGGIVVVTGELLGAVLAHVLINYENLHFIDAYDPRPGPRRRVSEPPIVDSFRSRTVGRW